MLGSFIRYAHSRFSLFVIFSMAAALCVGLQAPPATAAQDADTDPANWSDSQLAASLVLAGVQMNNVSQAKSWARAGIAGIVLFGSAPSNLSSKLRQIRAAAPGQRFLISSDEEGGSVQRLSRILGRLPSAQKIARTKSPRQAKQLAFSYAKKMKATGVNVALSPVADLSVPGSYIAGDGRSFSGSPTRAATYVKAWSRGIEQANVMSVVKHWPGHGSAKNTHVGSGRTAPWSTLQHRELVPFNAAFRAGAPAVMVGHLIVPGLTTSKVPASLSKPALRALRTAAGPDTLIMTDSLSMGAVTSAMHQSATQAAVRSLVAGADIALVTSDPMGIARAIRIAIENGTLPRAQAIASARRVLLAQARWA